MKTLGSSQMNTYLKSSVLKKYNPWILTWQIFVDWGKTEAILKNLNA